MQLLSQTFWVGLGGACGAILRYLVGQLPITSSFPFKTLVINILGSFLIGILSAYNLHHGANSLNNALLITGLCGGFTTFSTFSLESITLFQQGNLHLAMGYIATSLLLSLAAVWLGLTWGKQF